MHTAGPRRYSKLELCSTRQLEHLTQEFCYDVDTLRKVRSVLEARTCRHSAHVKRDVDRQLKALTSGPPRPKSWRRPKIYVLVLVLTAAVVLAMAVDVVRAAGWFAFG